MDSTPIVLFVYNRLWHTKKTVEALKKNDLAQDTCLFIFSDGPTKDTEEDVKKVREYLNTVKGFKEIQIIQRKTNLGLSKSIISGVTEILSKYKTVIVLEDDMVTSPTFLNFMNEALRFYEKKNNVFCISGYNYPNISLRMPVNYPFDVYGFPRAGSWSWATWRDRWAQADWSATDFESFLHDKMAQKEFNKGGTDLTETLIKFKQGSLDVWAVLWSYTLFKKNGICIYPKESFVDNIGFDNTGVNCGSRKSYKFRNKKLNKKNELKFLESDFLNPTITKKVQRLHEINLPSKIHRKISNIYKKTLCRETSIQL